ncbi:MULTISPECIES: DUF4235 domain-containing protein [Streptomyces]|uniref:DUF4235 domain-containing protein n=1 Tax=Streptomyces chilikensis TaxID=1194079 RepID=A0ABV3ETK3_9ACTN|nr:MULTISPECIES: DUF4235 domain-containing protein [Streptomyces]MDH6228704.1 hypothetical protein [Streptomyces sp. MJP52]
MATYTQKKQHLPTVYKPLGFAVSWGGGRLATAAFQKTWKAIRHEDDAPDALDRDRRWGEILLAAAIQGAIFAVVRAVIDRTSAQAVEHRTGVWPEKAKGKGRD